ncbi:MAG: DUF885 family protein [Bacteroidota bacterium]
MKLLLRTRLGLFLVFSFVQCTEKKQSAEKPYNTHEHLVRFFIEWRKFNRPEMIDGVPDYSPAALANQYNELATWKQHLNAFDTTGWPVSDQVDWYLLLAEMNGMEFEYRTVKPWERDPAFYIWFYTEASDVPEREGPNIRGAIELPRYDKPLDKSGADEITKRLASAPAVFEMARKNLTGNARDLWITGTRSIRENAGELRTFAASVKNEFPELAKAAEAVAVSTDSFGDWLDQQKDKKTGPSGVGKEEYTWNLKNVHLVPLTWEEEKLILERELYRSHAGLRLSEHANRNLPKLVKADNAEDYRKLLMQGVDEFMSFLDEGEFMTVKEYMKPAMLEQIRPFVPTTELRGFFDEVDHRDPMPMRAHHYHWIDKARERIDLLESVIRREPTLYNIFDSRAEGMATAMEELVMNGGLLKNRPRATELVYIMLAQRCARGLGGLYQHSLEMDFKQATEYASKWVPWGLLPADGGTIQHEEQFYIQQPGYGSSYVTGKVLIDQLIAEYARQREGSFTMKQFMDEYNSKGIIPVSLIYWEMTGDKSMLNKALGL